MSLYFDVKISGHVIARFFARRTAGTTHPDSIGTYTVSIADEAGLIDWEGTVHHRYGDGAFAFIARAITAAGLYADDGQAPTTNTGTYPLGGPMQRSREASS